MVRVWQAVVMGKLRVSLQVVCGVCVFMCVGVMECIPFTPREMGVHIIGL